MIWPNLIPIPEPVEYVEAQLRALMDPSSSRDTILITPGTPIPTLPEGLHIGETFRGTVITLDPSKISMVNSDDEVIVGQALFGYGREQTPDAQQVVQALDNLGLPVAEIVTTLEDLPAAAAAALECMPAGGRINLTTRAAINMERMNRILNNRRKNREHLPGDAGSNIATDPHHHSGPPGP